jgi:uncharacterized protein
MTIERALAELIRVLDRHERLAIAVSGGVDSMTLAHVAHRFSRARSTMYHAAGPAVPTSAGNRVASHATRHGWSLATIDAGEIDDARYRANPLDRCYYCKTNLYTRIRSLTCDTIASGTNTDDLSDFRPGLRAASERDVVHPYVEAGIDKEGVYAVAKRLGLGDLERLPAQPCLSSRVETGIAIDEADLAFIDAVESELAERLGRDRVLRCRVTYGGIVIELADANDDTVATLARKVAESACRGAKRTFAGVRPYSRGSAFLRVATDG